MTTDWMTVAAGWLFIAVMSAPIWLAPLTERWTEDEGRHYSGTWDE